jgi:aminotransferase
VTTARRTHGFRESVIRGMTRLAREYGSINLAQGFPNFPAPELLKEAAARAIRDDVNQYAITWGAQRLRTALARVYAERYGMAVDPERELTVTCGATEAMISAMLATVNPGDEVVVFEPFYENYGPDAILSDARPVFVPLEPGRPLDLERLAAAFGPRTRAIVVNTPANPSGRVLTRAELAAIRDLCVRHDALAVTDEIYEHIRYEGDHVPLATLDGMRERTITISGASKTFSVTGWRIGWIVAPAHLTDAIRKVHDFLTVGAPAPLQEGVAAGLETLADDFYAHLAADYRRRRDVLHAALVGAGFRCTPPEGAYYILADFGALAEEFGGELLAGDDTAFAVRLSREIGVTPVPGSSFYHDPALGRTQVRFVFCKTDDVLTEASARLAGLRARLAAPAEAAPPPPRDVAAGVRSGWQS